MRDDEEIRSDLPPTTDDQNNNKEIVTRKKGKLGTNSTNVIRNLPVVLLSNIQSFGRSYKNDKSTEMELILNHNNVDIAVFTETWLCHDTSDQLPFNDYVKFHRIRENVLRYSGGVSIFVHTNIPATKLDVKIPENLECLWVSVRPKWLPRSISNMIICGIYYPGSGSKYAPPQEDFVIYLTESVQKFMNRYANPLFMLMGDFNDLNIDEICEICRFQQVVKVPTRNEAILDLILTNTNNVYYEDPISLPKIGDGDHFPVLYSPKLYEKPNIQKKTIKTRMYKKSAMQQFGNWITHFNWCDQFQMSDVNEKEAYCYETIWQNIEKYFPLVKVNTSSNDKEWITSELKDLFARRQRAHMEGNNELRDCLAKKIRIKVKEAKIRYNAKKVNLFSKSNSRDWYRHVNNIIRNGEKNTINLVNIPELAYKSPEETSKIINNNFADICKKYPPLEKGFSVTKNPSDSDVKLISEHETYKLINRFAKKSLGGRDFPRQIVHEFAPELATPYSDITNCSLKTEKFPDQYKKAIIVPIPKTNPPRSLSDLRPISKTSIGGKIIEKRMLLELEKDIRNQLDTDQYGNERGCSTTHYLVKLTDEAFKSTDKGKATTAITIDYSKAFDYVSHTVLIDKLKDLKVRGSIINLIISFLSDRSHCTQISGTYSEYLQITCGVPQGTCSGPRLFVILINGKKCPLVSSYKFVDDKTLAHTYLGDPTELLQWALDIEGNETEKDQMIINGNKCNVITFNFSDKNTPPKDLYLDNKKIEPCESLKLLGVILSNDLKWSKNTAQICSKGNRRFYFLHRLKQFGLSKEELIKGWKSMIRPITEYAAPLWHSGLTEADIKKLEKLQKRALGIILGTTYIDNKRYYTFENKHLNYNEALEKTGLVSLAMRRETLTGKFALDAFKNERHNDIFTKKVFERTAGRYEPKVQEKHCATERYYKSAVPYMSRMLNSITFCTSNSNK